MFVCMCMWYMCTCACLCMHVCTCVCMEAGGRHPLSCHFLPCSFEAKSLAECGWSLSSLAGLEARRPQESSSLSFCSSGVTGAQNSMPGYCVSAGIRTLAPVLAQPVLHCEPPLLPLCCDGQHGGGYPQKQCAVTGSRDSCDSTRWEGVL